MGDPGQQKHQSLETKKWERLSCHYKSNITRHFPWIRKRREGLGNKERVYYGVGVGLDDE